jgi:hypothetical protein
MNCSRCGAAEAVLKRDAAFYCGKCALARDWEQVIALVQEERVDMSPSNEFGGGDAVAASAAGNGGGTLTSLPADPFA